MKRSFSKPWRVALLLVAALLCMFLLFLLIMSITDYKPGERIPLETGGSTEGALPAGRTFTVLSWNLGYFGLGNGMDFFYDGGKKVRPGKEEYQRYSEQGLEILSSFDTVDFLLLQEIDKRSKRSYRQDQVGAISQLLDDHEAYFAVNYKVLFVPVPLTEPMGGVLGGLACFMRHHPVECFREALPGQYSWPMGMFMLDRCFILSRFNLDNGKELVVINTHNEAFDSGDMRDQQMKHLRALMLGEYEKGNYVVAGGDWNMNPVGFTKAPFVTGDVAMDILPKFDSDFFPVGWSWFFDPTTPSNRSVVTAYERGKTPTTVIDFFIASPNIEALDVKTTDISFSCSDHQPVMMKFRCL